VFEQINGLAVDITARLEHHAGRVYETAFRYATETWM